MISEKPGKLKPALIGGVALGFASAIPYLGCCLNVFCCSLAAGGGLLAAFLYLKDAPATAEAPYGDGAVLGLIAGPVGAVVWLVLTIPITLVSQKLGVAMDPATIEKFLESFDLPREAIDQALQSVQSMTTDPVVMVAQLIVPFFILLFAFTVFAIVGGLIGAAMFHKKPTGVGVSAGLEPPPPPAV